MKYLRKFETYQSVNGEPNYIGGVDGEFANDDRYSHSETKTPIWVTKDGQKIPVSKMTLDHLKNSLNAIIDDRVKNKAEDKEIWAHILLEEILKRKSKSNESNGFEEFEDDEDDEDDSEDGPWFEPEECECREQMEEDGMEYTHDFFWDKEKESWVCEHCGMEQ
jgi:hypothetical protein